MLSGKQRIGDCAERFNDYLLPKGSIGGVAFVVQDTNEVLE
jgi:hypothetical protein